MSTGVRQITGLRAGNPLPPAPGTSGLEEAIPAKPHLPSSPASEMVGKGNHSPITRQLEEICPAPFLKLFFASHCSH